MKSPKDDQKDTKNKIPVSLTDEQRKIIDDMIGVYGNSSSAVIRNILVIWIHENLDKIKNMKTCEKNDRKQTGF